MDTSFGARLRAQRERKKVSLEEIAAVTKIKTALLEELESDRVRHWPTGLFRRAYIRDYARAIGVDPEPIVAEFLARYPDPFTVAEAEAEAAARAAAAARSPEARVRRFFSVLLGSAQSEPESVPEWTPSPEWTPPADLSAEANDAELAVEDIVQVRVVHEPPRDTVSLAAVADICTGLARATEARDVTALLAEMAQVLEATGIIVWAWDRQARILAPSLAHGYPDSMLQRIPAVPVDAGNAIAAAFRSAEAATVDGSANRPGAVVAPMAGPAGCVGVVSLEVRNGRERQEGIRSAARILAAQLATILDVPQAHQASA